MNNKEHFASYANDTGTVIERGWKIAKASGPALAEQLRDMKRLAIDQAQSNNQRLLSALDQVLAADSPADAGTACAHYVAESTRACVENLSEWSRWMLHAYRNATTSVLGSSPATADPADA